MKTKTKIVVIEDNQNTRELIRSFILAQDDMEIVGTAENGLKGFELIEKKKPDVVILDMIMPRMDGLEVLERVNAFNPEYSPSIICLSAVGQEEMIRKAVDLGAKYYMLKPFDFNIIIKRIREVSRNNGVASVAAPPSHKVVNVEGRISDIFLLVGIPAHIRGYHFLREAIKMVIEDKDCINRITKQLYPDVARKFNTTPSKVERAIRHAIDVAWSRGKAEGINQAFGYTVYGNYDKPTNGEFIALVADKLSIESMN
jgi:two-component system response regulator (stage 0 sporulation protein A)